VKATIKTTVNNIIYDPKEDTFSYTEELVSMKWTESKERAKYTQSGTGPGEFGPDYSDRKKYQLGYGNESPSPVLKRHLSEWIHAPDDGRINNPPHGVGYDPDDLKPVKRHIGYQRHVIEEYRAPIKRSRTTPLTKDEIEWRHAELKRKQEEN